MHYIDHANWPSVRYTLATESNPLAEGLRKIVALAQAALASGQADRDLLNAIQKIQGETFAVEMEYFGPEDKYEIDDDEIPF